MRAEVAQLGAAVGLGTLVCASSVVVCLVVYGGCYLCRLCRINTPRSWNRHNTGQAQ